MTELFFSYSHRDESLRDELETHLAMLRRQGVIDAWHDRRIVAGDDVDHTISQHLETAEIVLLLVSPYFLASDYCYDVEMTRALERHATGACAVIPVILDPCDWHGAPFGRLRATPKDGKPISKFANVHDAFLEVTKDIRKAAERFTSSELPVDEETQLARHSADEPHRQEVIRSSNLRVRREFSDQDRDRFVEAAMEYIARFFEASLEELQHRNEEIEARFRQTSGVDFTAAIYSRGTKKASCRVRAGGGLFGGDITYAASDVPADGSFSESLSVEDDGYNLGLTALGMASLGQGPKERLTLQGAAEYLWQVFLSPLQ